LELESNSQHIQQRIKAIQQAIETQPKGEENIPKNELPGPDILEKKNIQNESDKDNNRTNTTLAPINISNEENEDNNKNMSTEKNGEI